MVSIFLAHESMMKTYNIYITGVGGQGIGLLSEVLLRAADYAGFRAKGVDTHGLAQRGGIVTSHLRIGDRVHSPLIRAGQADVVVALERHEALRGMNMFLRDGGTLIYYNTVWQPLEVRLNQAQEVSEATISVECQRRHIRQIKVFQDDLEDARMQNMVLLAYINKHQLLPGVSAEHYTQALDDLLTGTMLEKNRQIFEKF
ncbi:pyruvate ferredoxin/flavodoxin oxidoreductase [Candidatus Vecturithrix granuli]|uniref:Pyruvate ferredoxin/flavodoxin oxidoreductase n=1 Tax=Vecturithrix granuli TaxID=1499967 RepID=A0A081C9C4_VECG1|nr:pyruvate ferredoxin/flavodoxin oxidoreductase [Candidatus Vecturithrix granuli]